MNAHKNNKCFNKTHDKISHCTIFSSLEQEMVDGA